MFTIMLKTVLFVSLKKHINVIIQQFVTCRQILYQNCLYKYCIKSKLNLKLIHK